MRTFTKRRPRRQKRLIPKLKVLAVPQLGDTQKLIIKGSDDAARMFRDDWNPKYLQYKEEAKVLYLKRSSQVIGIYDLSAGGMTGTVIDPKIIFGVALGVGSASFILCHNHPSGSLKPSQSDLRTTEKLVSGAKLLDISFLDHIILTAEGHFSFSDEGMIIH